MHATRMTISVAARLSISGPSHCGRITCRLRGVTLIESLLAVTVLSLSAASVLTAFVTGQSLTVQREKRQQALMLAVAMHEEIRQLPIFECDNWDRDGINELFSGYEPPAGVVHPYVEGGEELPTAGERENFDDMTDYAGYCDRNRSSASQPGDELVDGCWVGFRNRSGQELTLFSADADAPDDFAQPTLFRQVNVYLNDLDGLVSTASYVQVEVVVSDASEELVRLSRVYGQAARIMAGRQWSFQPSSFEPCGFVVCNADINDDGMINVRDLLQVVHSFGPCPGCAQDTDKDDVVDVNDLHNVVHNYGVDCSGG